MHTKKDLLSDLTRIKIEPSGTLMVHISCKAVGEVEGRGDTILDALSEYISSGLLVLPAHTWNVGADNPVTDVLQAIREGVLTLGSFGDASTRLMKAKPLRNLVAKLLKEDSGYLSRY